MPWYYIGSIMVVIGYLSFFYFPSFARLFDMQERISNEPLVNFYYIFVVCLFNTGWAFVQISNISIVNQLSYSNRRRDQLLNNRNGITYFSYILSFLVSMILFLTVDDDVMQFRYLMFTCLALGTSGTIIYILFIQEQPLSSEAKRLETQYQKFQSQRKSRGAISAWNDP